MTKTEYIHKLSQINSKSIQQTVKLLEEGASIPFIARYRKDVTDNLDELAIEKIESLGNTFDEILKRKSYIISVLEEKNALSDKLQLAIENTFDVHELEDIYLPFKSKRKTKADLAREAGLEGLAKIIMKQDNGDVMQAAQRFKHKDYPSIEDRIAGAKFIMAEWINENPIVRQKLRESFIEHGVLTVKPVKAKIEEGQKYRDYFDHSQRIIQCPSYRLLAILRGAEEGYLKIKIEPNKEYALSWLERFYVKNNNHASNIVKDTIKDAYKRLLQPGLETETKNHFKELADDQSISNFAKNLENLLLAPPVGGKRVLAIDPGFKSGCKVVCLDQTGSLLHNETVYPHPPQKDKSKASAKIAQLVQAYKIEVIAVGDGTAGRETEAFIKHIHFDRDLDVFIVREDGASIYSASKIAREEFPTYDVTVRGAVSIGRRLMDPLAELVKIDPKSLGVGQYQHDVNQVKLKKELDQVVVRAVNNVGVDLNVASKYLLAYVSGLGPTLAENIVQYRTENGKFKNREQLKEVPRMGVVAFQQAAGFLRVKEGDNPLDNSAVHPENYAVVERLIKKEKLKLSELIGNSDKVRYIKEKAANEIRTEVGKYTAEDIFNELEKPGRDPREKATFFSFSEKVRSIEDLVEGMRVNGVVTNVTDFGAFVNLGIKENGLIHKTQMADSYVAHPTDVLQINDQLNVRVISVDKERKRIGLSLKES
jgi:uncharacterized protein